MINKKIVTTLLATLVCGVMIAGAQTTPTKMAKTPKMAKMSKMGKMSKMKKPSKMSKMKKSSKMGKMKMAPKKM